jgi:cystathionine gamma-synthase
MQAVRGYEEKDPAITRHLTSGYPRFVVHPFTRQLAARWAEIDPALAGKTVWLTSSARMARGLAAHLGGVPAARTYARDGVHAVVHAASDQNAAGLAKLYLQHLGGFLSSREAEDQLIRLGALPAAQPEPAPAGDALATVRAHLRRAFPDAGAADLLPASCGMNAIASTFRAVSELQAARGRTVWVQLGWLYLDTIALLKKFTATPGDYVLLPDVFDRAALERLFAAQGSRIAGLITEVPTNPLIQTPDVPALAELCRKHGVSLVLDPSVVSAYSVNLLPHADVVVASLTKYTASEGDLVAGLVAVNPARPDAAALRSRIAGHLEPVYPRDLAALAVQIGRTEAVLARIQANVPRIVDSLSAHPGVGEVYWALHPASRDNYLKLARTPGSVGGLVTFTLKVPLEKFYDRLRLPKGPSFGMKTTLICPFMYLAHYDLVTTEAGRAELAAAGLDPDLLRLSVGAEPAEDIIAALAEALA